VLVEALEIVDAQEQADASDELLADDGRLPVAVGTREQDACPGPTRTHHYCKVRRDVRCEPFDMRAIPVR